ncbi:MAG: hypothetical protein VB137_11310 [Burkholderia sp.]
MLRGESIDAVSREVGVTIAELEQWRELALAGIEAGLKSRQTDPLEVKLKEAVHRVGELTMEVEMLRMERERQEHRPLIVRNRRHEPHDLRDRQTLRIATGMPGARLSALRDLCRARQGAQQGHSTCPCPT